MYSIEVLHSINNRPARKSAVQSRDCSVCFSRGGAVIHSARHRDTVFIYGSAKKIIFTLKLLKLPGHQAALNKYIELIYSRYAA